MTQTESFENLTALERALWKGDIPAVRETLFTLSEAEQERLKREVGDKDFNRIYECARRLRRGMKRGKVIVLHGIMGSELDSVKGGDADRVWVNYWRLFLGRIADLELSLLGGPAQPGVTVKVVGQMRKTYLPILLALDEQWHVRPFAYDWREDIRKSAEALAAEVTAFGNGGPVHLVAHSMGGLVARCFIKHYPVLWKSMAGPDDLVSGGRLVMLGTPNHGSYAIPLALSGEEKLVKGLALVDSRHDMKQLLRILNTFPGSYQMLPSPLVDIPDDHAQLYSRNAWGEFPVHQLFLDLAAQSHGDLIHVVDARRFLYVAGYNRSTPFRVKVEKPGKFLYQNTTAGDGRVPHSLGLLEGVRTYWVDEDHGSLPRNGDVLDAIHGLLGEGRTTILSTERPADRAVERAGWIVAGEFEEVPREFEELIKSESRRRGVKASALAPDDQMRLETYLLSEYLGMPRSEAGNESVTPEKPEKPPKGSGATKKPVDLEIEVVWGDITKVEGDVHCVGHYQGVLPQNAEFALDKALSDNGQPSRQVLRQHSIRGTLRGALGDVDFFPWHPPDGSRRIVAVAGMGYPGYFGADSLQTLIRRLSWAISGLPGIKTVCSVLIGSGAGTLTVEEAVKGFYVGLTRALIQEGLQSGIEKVRIVELYRHRAVEVLQHLLSVSKDVKIPEPHRVTVKGEILRGKESRVADEDALMILLHSLADISKGKADPEAAAMLEKLVNLASTGDVASTDIAGALAGVVSSEERKTGDRRSLKVNFVTHETAAQSHPTRISFLHDNGDIRVAAITETATVSERLLRFDPNLLREIVDGVNNQRALPVADVPDFMTRLLMPFEFRVLLGRDGPIVFELDRTMAQVPWEMLSGDPNADADGQPLGVRARMARQLRTVYSPAPFIPAEVRGRLKALIIGDPGDPAKEHNLPGAMEEAFRVRKVLESFGVEVQLRVASPNTPRQGGLRGVKPATRMETLHLLMKGGFDILHYSGHGDFAPESPDRAGWVFSEGLLTSREIERMDVAPALVFANACLSARTSEATAAGQGIAEPARESALLPSLVDEFFHKGVRNYVGTAWEVSDVGAILFAETFYKTLLSDETGPTIGEAVQTARNALYSQSHLYGQLWAAYQHYGDPTSVLKAVADGDAPQ